MPLTFRPEALEMARVDAGLTHTELARRAGVGRSSVYRAEKGRGKPHAQIVKAIADALGIDVTDLYEPGDGWDPGDAA